MEKEVTLEVSTWEANRHDRREYFRKNPNASTSQTLMAKSIAETDVSGTKKLVWYELSTNIPNEVKVVKIKTKVTDIGVYITIGQDGEYIDIKNFGKHRAKGKDSDKTYKASGKSPNEGSFFGTGTAYIDSNVHNYLTHVLTTDGVWDTEVRETGMVYDLPNIVETEYSLPQTHGVYSQEKLDSWREEGFRVVQTFLVRNSLHQSNEEILEEMGKVFGITFGIPIKTKDITIKINDKVVDSVLTYWADKDKNGNSIPKFQYLLDSSGKDIKIVSVTSNTNRKNRKAQCDFRITSVGKRKKGEKEIMYLLDQYDEGTIGDRPVLILRLPNGQFIGSIFLRSRGGDDHLNRVIVEATVERADIIQFFGKLSKGQGWVKDFEANVGKEFRKQLEKACYLPDDTLEECKQNHVYNVIVWSSYGNDVDEDSANDHRDCLGLSFLNKMTPEERDKYVTMEDKDGINRYDISVRVPKGTILHLDGVDKSFDEEVFILIENKKVKWKDADCKQSTHYASSKLSCVYVWGMSIQISDEMKKNFSDHFTQLEKGKQFRLDSIGGTLIDLKRNHWRWSSVEDYYRNELAESKNNK
jgi:hypothetical protein